MKKIIFAVVGMTCAACVAHVERAARGALGEDVPFTVSLLSSTLTVTAADETDEVAVIVIDTGVVHRHDLSGTGGRHETF